VLFLLVIAAVPAPVPSRVRVGAGFRPVSTAPRDGRGGRRDVAVGSRVWALAVIAGTAVVARLLM
jgi:hypothetical protein